MSKKNVITAILSVLIVANLTFMANAQRYDEMPDGFTFTAEFTGRTVTAMPENRIRTTKPESDSNTKPIASIGTAEYASKTIGLINLARKKHSLSPLSTDNMLTQMAQTRAEELIESFSHIRPDGRKPTTVLTDFDCDLKFWGENIAKGQKTPQKVVSAWLDSKSHSECMLDEEANYIAVACVVDENGRVYWASIYAK